MKKFIKRTMAVATVTLTLVSALTSLTTVSADQGVTDTTIRVGNSAAISGAYAPVGAPFIAGIEAYFEMINSEGGVDGKNIEFVHIDDEFDPAKGKAALQTLVEDEEIFALVGHFGTPVVAATIDDIKSYGIPVVYFATGIGATLFESS